MTLKRYDGAAFTDIAAIKRYDGAAWVDLTVLKRWDGAAWVDITLPGGGGGSLSATVSPSSLSGVSIDPEPAPSTKLVSTSALNPAVVTASGGTAPYTYAWTNVAGSPGIYANSPTAASTRFSAICYKNREKVSTMRCTITDSAGSPASVTVDVEVTLEYANTA